MDGFDTALTLSAPGKNYEVGFDVFWQQAFSDFGNRQRQQL